jgi:hypothetical protein
MKKTVVIAFILFFSKIYGQDNTMLWSENQSLEWRDFVGIVKDTSRFDAESFAEVRYHYKRNEQNRLNFEVYAHFNKNASWYRPGTQTEALLKHEQLHFDIAELYARKLKQAFETYPYSENFQAEVLAVFNEIKNDYHEMQHLYDEETNHSLNRDKQTQWSNTIHEALMQMKQVVEYATNK